MTAALQAVQDHGFQWIFGTGTLFDFLRPDDRQTVNPGGSSGEFSLIVHATEQAPDAAADPSLAQAD
jgi:hypothetical protein